MQILMDWNFPFTEIRRINFASAGPVLFENIPEISIESNWFGIRE